MKKNLFYLIFCLTLTTIFAQTYSPKEADSLLKMSEDNTAFFDTDFYGNYSIVQSKPGEGKSVTEAKMYRRDKDNKWVILITSPKKEIGKGYLQLDGSIWFYDPEDKRFTFTSAKDKFNNTNANNSDFVPQRYYSDYAIESFESVKLGNLDCILFTLKAKVESVDYPKVKLWVTKNDGLARKKEDYSLSGKLMRTTAIPSYQKIESTNRTYSIPVNMLIMDNLRGKKIDNKMQYEKTQITITNPSFKKVEDSIYTKPFLEMMGTK